MVARRKKEYAQKNRENANTSFGIGNQWFNPKNFHMFGQLVRQASHHTVLVKYTIMAHNTQVDEFPKNAIGGWL